MLILSLTSLIEEAVLSGPEKRLSGNVASFDELMQPESLRLLESRFAGVFAFMAFHPGVDHSVLKYVEEGSLASDSGPNILTLFTLAQDATAPTTLNSGGFSAWLNVDSGELPAYRLIRELFEPRAVPPLPGIAFFERFSSPSEAVYLPFSDMKDADEIRQSLRIYFSLADEAFRISRRQSDRSFADLIATSAQRKRLPLVRSGPVSMRQWLIRAYQFVGDHAGDVVGIIGLIK